MPQEQRIDLAAIREMSPAYADLSDQQILDSVYDRHYADRMTRAQFDNRTGGRRAFNVDDVGGQDHRVTTESPEQAMELAQLWASVNEPGAPTQDYNIDGEMVEATSEAAARAFVAGRVMVTDPGIFEMSSGDARYARALGDARDDLAPLLDPETGEPIAGEYGFTDALSEAPTLGLQGPFNGLMAGIGQGVQNLFGEDEYGPTDAFNASRQAYNERRNQYAEDHPRLNLAANVLGGFAAPGSIGLARYAGGGQGLLQTMGRNSLVGLGTGGTYGFTMSDPGEEGQDTALGGVTGLLAGAGLPLALRAGAGAVRGPLRAVQSGVNAATGGRVFGGNTERTAGQQLAAALRFDGIKEADFRAAMNEWLSSGVTPRMLDLLPRGGAAQRLIRGSAQQAGGASAAAERYSTKTAANLQDRALALTRGLTPDETRPASQVVDSLTRARRQTADIDYRPAYAERIPVGQDVMGALAGDAGLPAVRLARRTADSNRRWDEVAELDNMIAAIEGGQSVTEATAGAIDAIRRAMAGRGADMARNARTQAQGAGLTGRAADIDTALDGVPGLAPARNAFARSSRQIEAVERGQQGLTAMPDDFAFQRPSDVLPQAQVGYRQALTDAIGAPAEGAAGILNRVSTADNQTRNLATVFGPSAAERYQGGLQNLTQQMQNARAIQPSFGSQTAPLTLDQQLVSGTSIPTGPISGLLWAVGKIRRGMTLSPQEREAIVGLATRDADPALLRYRNREMPVSGQLGPAAARLAGMNQ